MKRICCNPECGIIVDEADCMDYKHPIGARLCPSCYEITEIISDEEELLDENEQKILCSICIRAFGKEQAKVATYHQTGLILGHTFHLCAEHFIEKEMGR